MPITQRKLRYLRLLVLLSLYIASFAIVQAGGSAAEISDEDSSSEGEEGELIERNPHYVGVHLSESDGETSDSDSDSDSDDDMDADHDDVGEKEISDKTVLSKALSRSKKGTSRSLSFIRKHRNEITFALVLFAFRREILGLARSLLLETTPDGKNKMRRIPLSPTSILKIILFIDIMRKIQSGSQDGQASSPSTASLLSGPAGILSMFHESNPAYLPPVEQHYTFERIDERYTKDVMALKKALETPRVSFTGILASKRKKADREPSKGGTKSDMIRTTGPGSTIFNTTTAIILDFTSLDTSVSQINVIRDEISFVLYSHRSNREAIKDQANRTSSNTNATLPELEVIVLLESPGGSASDYGLGASQLYRLRDEPGISLTVCVDKVAASGGYMMACVAHRLLCAPFAVVGSIGVIGQALNFHNTLQNWGVRPLVFRGGKDKAPVGVIGEVTKEGIAKVQSMVDKTHDAFKHHVVSSRPALSGIIEDVATGDVFLGRDALKAGLVDRVVTSDEYIVERMEQGVKVLKLIRHTRRTLHLFGTAPGRQGPFVESVVNMQRILSRVAELMEQSFPQGSRGDYTLMGASSLSASTRWATRSEISLT